MENQPETKPDYFIQIPPEVLFEPRLSPGAKILYGDILFLNHNYGFCSQKNAYFAANYHVCVKTVQNWICELKTLDLIRIELIRNQNKEVKLRKIFALVQVVQSQQVQIEKAELTEQTGRTKNSSDKNEVQHCAPLPRKIPALKKEKKAFGTRQNVFLTETEEEELLKKITKEQFSRAVEIYGSWKLKCGANPRSDFISIGWAVRQALNPAAKTTGRMSAVQAAGCDEVTDETLEKIPF